MTVKREDAGGVTRAARIGRPPKPQDTVGDPALNFPVERRNITGHRRKDVARDVMESIALDSLNLGTAINERELFQRSPPDRYKRGNCIIVMRRIHKRFPGKVRLELVDSLFTLIPIPEGS